MISFPSFTSRLGINRFILSVFTIYIARIWVFFILLNICITVTRYTGWYWILLLSLLTILEYIFGICGSGVDTENLIHSCCHFYNPLFSVVKIICVPFCCFSFYGIFSLFVQRPYIVWEGISTIFIFYE